MKKWFIGVYNPTIWLTYIGVFCAVLGIRMLLCGGSMDTAMILLILAGVCDMFDGAVARRFKRTEQEKQFGIQLDSLADTVSFGVFPAVILLSVTGGSIPGIIIACFYVFAGIMRLGWFNVTTEDNRGFYQGLPITFSALIIPLCYLVLRLLKLDVFHLVFPVVFVCVGLMLILNFRMIKPGMKVLLLFAALAVAVIVGLLLI